VLLSSVHGIPGPEKKATREIKSGCEFAPLPLSTTRNQIGSPTMMPLFNSDEPLVEFVRGGNGVKTLEDKNILDMQIKSNSGEVTLDLNLEQYAKLRK